MPDRVVLVLCVNVPDVLDRSRAGKQAAAALEARFQAARQKRATLEEGVEAARFEIDAVREIEGERTRLREELLAKARRVCEEIRQEKGAALVVDRSVVLAWDPALDVTNEVLARLDR